MTQKMVQQDFLWLYFLICDNRLSGAMEASQDYMTSVSQFIAWS